MSRCAVRRRARRRSLDIPCFSPSLRHADVALPDSNERRGWSTPGSRWSPSCAIDVDLAVLFSGPLLKLAVPAARPATRPRWRAYNAWLIGSGHSRHPACWPQSSPARRTGGRGGSRSSATRRRRGLYLPCRGAWIRSGATARLRPIYYAAAEPGAARAVARVTVTFTWVPVQHHGFDTEFCASLHDHTFRHRHIIIMVSTGVGVRFRSLEDRVTRRCLMDAVVLQRLDKEYVGVDGARCRS